MTLSVKHKKHSPNLHNVKQINFIHRKHETRIYTTHTYIKRKESQRGLRRGPPEDRPSYEREKIHSFSKISLNRLSEILGETRLFTYF